MVADAGVPLAQILARVPIRLSRSTMTSVSHRSHLTRSLRSSTPLHQHSLSPPAHSYCVNPKVEVDMSKVRQIFVKTTILGRSGEFLIPNLVKLSVIAVKEKWLVTGRQRSLCPVGPARRIPRPSERSFASGEDPGTPGLGRRGTGIPSGQPSARPRRVFLLPARQYRPMSHGPARVPFILLRTSATLVGNRGRVCTSLRANGTFLSRSLGLVGAPGDRVER